MGYFTLKPGSNGQYYFSLHASNGERILQSEGYMSKQGAENGIASVKSNAPIDSRYERKTATNGQFYFVLKSGNGEIIGTSETYISQTGRENGIQSVKSNAPVAPIRY